MFMVAVAIGTLMKIEMHPDRGGIALVANIALQSGDHSGMHPRGDRQIDQSVAVKLPPYRRPVPAVRPANLELFGSSHRDLLSGD
jgi:hypothetical protein